MRQFHQALDLLKAASHIYWTPKIHLLHKLEARHADLTATNSSSRESVAAGVGAGSGRAMWVGEGYTEAARVRARMGRAT